MAAISRREFLKTASTDMAVAGLLAAGGARIMAAPLGMPIGSQTYPHRAMIKDGNFAGLLKTLADIGVKSVELCSPIGYGEFAPLADGKETAKILADHGMTCESSPLQHARAAREAGARASSGPRTSASRR